VDRHGGWWAPTKWKDYHTGFVPGQLREGGKKAAHDAFCRCLPLFAPCAAPPPGRSMPQQAIKSGGAGAFLALVSLGLAATTDYQERFVMSKNRISTNWHRPILSLLVVLLAAGPLTVSAATPDPVLEWIGVMNTTVLKAGTAPNVTGRVVALVSASVFDAVNGIEPRFRPVHVSPDAPHNASQRAAAIQAAYVILMNLYGAQQGGTLTSQHDASLAALASAEKPESIAAGVAWGQSVADAIWTWRLADGFAPTPPPFFGVQSIAGTPNSLGFWRPTPPANASGATPQIATMTPWVLTRPSQFRLPPPLALNSPDGGRIVLGAEHTPRLEPCYGAAFRGARPQSDRECAFICSAQCNSRRCDNRVLG
jgi:hypothetical protein